MKPTLYLLLFVLFMGLSLSTEAQHTTYPITSNVNTSSFGGGVICTNCIIAISPGVTITIDNNCGCNTCNFVGGTVVIKAGSSFALTGIDSFKNMQVYVNQSFSQNNNLTFYGDTIAFNTSLNLSNGQINIDSSRVSVNANLTLNKTKLDKDSLHLNANLTVSNATDTFSNNHVTVATGNTINTQNTLFTNNTFAFQGSSSIKVANSMTSSNNKYYLAGTSTIVSNNTTTLSGDSITMNGTTNAFTTSYALTTTNTIVNMSSTSSSSFTGGSLSSTGGSITANSNASVTIANAVSLVNTDVTLTSAKFTGGNTTISGGVFRSGSSTFHAGTLDITGTTLIASNTTWTADYAATVTNTSAAITGGTFSLGSLTTTGGSITARSTTLKSTYAVAMTNTAASFTGSTFSASQLTTTGGSFTATSSAVSSTYAVSLTNTPASFTGSIFSGSQYNVTGSSFGLDNSSLTSTYAVDFDNAPITMSGTSTLTGSQATIQNGSILTMTGTAAIAVTYNFSVDKSQAYLYGNNNIRSGGLSVTNHAWLRIGDGTLANTSYIKTTGSLNVDNTSNMGISNNQNNLQSGSFSGNTISCGGGGTQNACAAGYLYGCSTINNNSAVACTVLATANIDLTAAAAAPGQVTINFTDIEITTAERYLVQRNSGDSQWNTINTINAGGYTNGEYHFTDADAPAGQVEYRIERIDQNGKILYSVIAAVTVTETTATAVGIHPNPATGGNFFVTTPYTGGTIVNVYTLTGQLLLHSELKGQTQYAIHLPAQTTSLGAVVVQTIGQGGTRSFTVLVH
jgi:hypothetical protein